MDAAMTLLVVLLVKGTAWRRRCTIVELGWVGSMNLVGTSVVQSLVYYLLARAALVLQAHTLIPQHYVLEKDIANAHFLRSDSIGL